MRQIIVIHGGHSAHPTYDDYISYLKAKKLDISRLNHKDWKATLQETLGLEYEVIQPHMPNKENAHYLEWKIWFEKFIPYMHDEVILIGHSLGGIFLAKYLSEEKFPKNILATLLVAAPFNTGRRGHIDEFALPESLDNFSAQSSRIILYQSKDDHVVNFTEVKKYQKALPEAKVNMFDDRGHFNQEQFPELVEDIKALS